MVKRQTKTEAAASKSPIVSACNCALSPIRQKFPCTRLWFIQLCKFMMVGSTSALIVLALLYSLTEFAGLYYLYSAAVALFMAAINGYYWNHKWTFKTEAIRRHHVSFSKYLALITCTYFLNLSLLALFYEVYGIWYILSETIAISIGFFINFFGSKYWAFR